MSEFTTYYPCCAPRVSNIQRAAQLLDGTVIRPAARSRSTRRSASGRRSAASSLRHRSSEAGSRTRSAAASARWRRRSTTRPSSPGSASTRTRRTSSTSPATRWAARRPCPGAAPSSSSPTTGKRGCCSRSPRGAPGISVRFYSTKLGRRVETVTEEPYAYRQPTTRRTRNPSLKPGEQQCACRRPGGPGFTVAYTRKVYRGDKLLETSLPRALRPAERVHRDRPEEEAQAEAGRQASRRPQSPGAADATRQPAQGDDQRTRPATNAG